MRLQTTGKHRSVCEPNQGRRYNDTGQLVRKSELPRQHRKTYKLLCVRKARHDAKLYTLSADTGD